MRNTRDRAVWRTPPASSAVRNRGRFRSGIWLVVLGDRAILGGHDLGGSCVDELGKRKRKQHAIDRTMQAQERGARRDESTVYSCPDCGGVLWQFDDGPDAEFGCHTGHRYQPDTLLARQSVTVTYALYAAVRALREQSILLRQFAAVTTPGDRLKTELLAAADQKDTYARSIRNEVLGGEEAHVEESSDAALQSILRELRRPPDD